MEPLDLHVLEDDLEAYVLHRADDYLTDAIEDHLLLCPLCRMVLDRVEEEIDLIRELLGSQLSCAPQSEAAELD